MTMSVPEDGRRSLFLLDNLAPEARGLYEGAPCPCVAAASPGRPSLGASLRPLTVCRGFPGRVTSRVRSPCAQGIAGVYAFTSRPGDPWEPPGDLLNLIHEVTHRRSFFVRIPPPGRSVCASTSPGNATKTFICRDLPKHYTPGQLSASDFM